MSDSDREHRDRDRDRRRSGKKRSYQSSLFVRNLVPYPPSNLFLPVLEQENQSWWFKGNICRVKLFLESEFILDRYAEPKDVYLPSDFRSREHRGFGFVEFHTEE